MLTEGVCYTCVVLVFTIILSFDILHNNIPYNYCISIVFNNKSMPYHLKIKLKLAFYKAPNVSLTNCFLLFIILCDSHGNLNFTRYLLTFVLSDGLYIMFLYPCQNTYYHILLNGANH